MIRKLDPIRYSWKHVWTVMKGHGSLSFKTNNEGHQEELFWANTMGGSGDNMYGYQTEYGGNLFIPLTIYKH